MGTPVCHWSSKSTSVAWDLGLPSEADSQFCGTGPLTCGV